MTVGLPSDSAQLRALLNRVLVRDGAGAQLVAEQHLGRARVFRLGFEIDGQPRSLVVKRFEPIWSLRERLALTRWMPAADLGAQVPMLLGTTAEATGRWIWHVYEDLGDWLLARGPFDPERARAAIDLIVQVHVRFAGHRLLGEVRSYSGDRGAGFFAVCLRDTINALRALRPPAVQLSLEHLALCDRLLWRLEMLQQEQHGRAVLMAEADWTETLLHGDLWPTNIMVLPAGAEGRRQALLIDWDHVAVGPLVYDLSTLLTRLDRDKRPWVLDSYRAAIGREAGWRLPDRDRLNRMFETCEQARLAHALLWPAIAAAEPSSTWAFERMAEIERWFEDLQPVLP